MAEPISLRELAFVAQVLIPRAWVQGPETDELVALRTKIERIFASVRDESREDAKEGESASRT